MTTELDFRRALAANPDDADARMVFADWLDEQDRPREACVNRIVAQPDEDRHRLDFAAWLERASDSTQARFIRWSLVNGVPAKDGQWGMDEPVFRRVACPWCEGSGYRPRVNSRLDVSPCPDCSDCNGTGDVGGLTWKRNQPIEGHYTEEAGGWVSNPKPHVVRWRRGCPERVECRLADVVDSAGHSMGSVTWYVTDWARRVCRWHPVLELWVTDRPAQTGLRRRRSLYSHGWGYTLRELPELVFDSLRDYADVNDGEKVYETDLQAHAALACGLARLARA